MWLGTMSLAILMPRRHARSFRLETPLAAELRGNRVVGQGIGGGLGILVSHPPLDFPGRRASLPHTDQPQRREAAPRKRVQLLSGTWSRCRIFRLYARESWSSHTRVFFAIMTARGIQSLSG